MPTEPIIDQIERIIESIESKLTKKTLPYGRNFRIRAIHHAYGADYRSNRTDYRIDRIELDKKPEFFRFGFSAFFRPPSVVQS